MKEKSQITWMWPGSHWQRKSPVEEFFGIKNPTNKIFKTNV